MGDQKNLTLAGMDGWSQVGNRQTNASEKFLLIQQCSLATSTLLVTTISLIPAFIFFGGIRPC
jgi:hypothetical protein